MTIDSVKINSHAVGTASIRTPEIYPISAEDQTTIYSDLTVNYQYLETISRVHTLPHEDQYHPDHPTKITRIFTY